MKESDALAQVARLFTAFPASKADVGNAKAYAEQLVRLRHPEALAEAVDSLIRSERWLPPISAILDEYNRYKYRHEPPAIEVHSEVTEDERRDNLKRIHALRAHLAAEGQHGHTVGIEGCPNPECQVLQAGD